MLHNVLHLSIPCKTQNLTVYHIVVGTIQNTNIYCSQVAKEMFAATSYVTY